ncbi:Cell division protein FtsW [hydrothermal vent metagenome]|uniref:peptidoglycan glycosyltransferase n=1 Tax=hydrothermal vent metagenome TaxID=652676 RepID=A0A1W1DZE5_9ZZZZ
MFDEIFDKTDKLPDKKLLFVILALVAFGWIMSSSASIEHSAKQGIFIGVGMMIGSVILFIPLSFFKQHSRKLFILTLFLLTLVFIPGITAGVINGSMRWIDLIFFNFQPSEMMKLVMILYIANFLVRREKMITSSRKGLVIAFAIIGTSSVLTMAETDFGATLLIAVIALGMLFLAGAYIKELLILGAFTITVASIYVFLDPTRWERWTVFWADDLWHKPLQTLQSLIAVGRGDWTGTGLGAGIQKYSKLPEAHTDMIFSIVGEETGIVGMFFVLFSFAYILNKGFNIASEALKDNRKYSYYVAYGICIWFGIQIGVNISMNLGLIPIKGYALPLISYGGTSMLFSLSALAILLRIDMENRAKHKKRKNYV